jgi:hypothetical protein
MDIEAETIPEGEINRRLLTIAKLLDEASATLKNPNISLFDLAEVSDNIQGLPGRLVTLARIQDSKVRAEKARENNAKQNELAAERARIESEILMLEREGQCDDDNAASVIKGLPSLDA